MRTFLIRYKPLLILPVCASVNFVHTLDPNVPPNPSVDTTLPVQWPEYASEPDGALLVYTDTGFTYATDVHRRDAMALVTALGEELGRRKGPGREK